ncbi:hypothetical protein C3L56_03080 [Veillonellaceae bacterium M2-4]|nr:hypothetical protein [Veillonellaceae bacterium M2-4]
MPTKTLCYTAIMIALVFLLTFIPKIPIPFGYAHLGDSLIFALPFCLHSRSSAVAAGVGSALADLFGGFPIWIIPTIIIKVIMVYVIVYVLREQRYSLSILSWKVFFAILLSSIWMVIGYSVSGGLLYGVPAGIAMIPGLIGEGIVNLIIAYGIITAVRSLLASQRGTI